MDERTKHRKARLQALIDGKPYLGNQSAFAKKAGLTKGRVSQLLDDELTFGELAGMKLALKLGLHERYFDGNQEPPTEKTLSPADALDAALEVLSKALIEVDEEARALVGHSLSRLAQDPSKLRNISQHVRTLIFTNGAKSRTADTGRDGRQLTDLPRGIGPGDDREHLPVSQAQGGGKK